MIDQIPTDRSSRCRRVRPADPRRPIRPVVIAPRSAGIFLHDQTDGRRRRIARVERRVECVAGRVGRRIRSVVRTGRVADRIRRKRQRDSATAEDCRTVTGLENRHVHFRLVRTDRHRARVLRLDGHVHGRLAEIARVEHFNGVRPGARHIRPQRRAVKDHIRRFVQRPQCRAHDLRSQIDDADRVGDLVDDPDFHVGTKTNGDRIQSDRNRSDGRGRASADIEKLDAIVCRVTNGKLRSIGAEVDGVDLGCLEIHERSRAGRAEPHSRRDTDNKCPHFLEPALLPPHLHGYPWDWQDTTTRAT